MCIFSYVPFRKTAGETPTVVC
uniref:Uncharacterized protein n=1 Tax=Arundo donax TaxID=35708 RepID=A0A0A9BIU6_ARUDO